MKVVEASMGQPLRRLCAGAGPSVEAHASLLMALAPAPGLLPNATAHASACQHSRFAGEDIGIYTAHCVVTHGWHLLRSP
jgi:hypothetical protein